jgi:hypothetical protein
MSLENGGEFTLTAMMIFMARVPALTRIWAAVVFRPPRQASINKQHLRTSRDQFSVSVPK